MDRTSAKPLHRQLYEGYRDAIVARLLRAGQRLPSTRTLAGDLSLSRITVLNAFDQLLAEGYVESRVGAGTFVASSVPDELPARPSRASSPAGSDRKARRRGSYRVDDVARHEPGPWFRGRGPFSVAQPPLDRFPWRVWSRLVARAARRLDSELLHYTGPMGYKPLREAVAEYLRTSRAVRCEADQLMVVGGAQHALDVSARALLDPGDPVWIEEPGYFGARRALSLAGCRLVPVPVDEEGLDVESGIARYPRARAAYVTPSHHVPLGVTMSASRRLRLLDWARRSGAWIVEDDYDSEYRYGSQPITSLQGLDGDSRVVYAGTLTKMIFPSLRLGYIVVPPDLIDAFMAVRRATDFFCPIFPQVVLTDFIREGHLGRHIRRMRKLCESRRTALVEAIAHEFGEELRILGDRAGMFLATTLPKGCDDRAVASEAARRGLWAPPLSECYLGRARLSGLVLGYGGFDEETIRAGVRLLRQVVDATRVNSGRRPVR